MVNVLVVDDDANIQHSTKAFLEAQGYDVFCAGNGLEAQDVMADCVIDIAIIDLFMPKQGGIETIAQCRTGLPIIAVSGEMDGRLSPQEVSESLHVDFFLNKPFQAKELLNRIKNLLEGEATTSVR